MIKIFHQNVFDKWKLPDNSVQAIITSPPYYALRKYDIPDVIIGCDKNCQHEFLSKDAKLHSLDHCVKCKAFKGQYGLEPTPYDYVDHTILWAREAHRVLKDDGLFFLNIGDSYSSSTKGTGGNCGRHIQDGKNKHGNATRFGVTKINTGMPQKTKMLIPHRIAIALIDDGWILRNDIIWHKPNAMPEPCRDRFSKKYENVFMFSKSKKYYFDLDAVREKCKPLNRWGGHIFKAEKESQWDKGTGQTTYRKREVQPNNGMKNPGDMWAINTQPLKVNHYACVTQDTEILTINGWLTYDKFDKYNCGSFKGVKIATYNLQTNTIEYKPLNHLKVYDFKGELIRIRTRSLDILMTSNHMNVIKDNKNNIKLKEAKDIQYNDKIMVRSDVFYKPSYSIGIIWAELVGWIISDGGYLTDYKHVAIYQNEGEKANRIRSLLSKAEIPYTEYKRIRLKEDGFHVGNIISITFYIKLCSFVDFIIDKFPNKILNKLVTMLPKNELNYLMDGLIGEDGTIRKDSYRKCFTQKNKECVDWFEILALYCGYHTNTVKRIHSDVYDVNLTNKTAIGIRGTNGHEKQVSTEYYKGKIWCPSVNNKTWVAKRNGKVFITGNSFPEELPRRAIRCSTKEGDTVLDPFVGSGRTLKVADELNRQGLGIDLGYKDVQDIVLKRKK